MTFALDVVGAKLNRGAGVVDLPLSYYYQPSKIEILVPLGLLIVGCGYSLLSWVLRVITGISIMDAPFFVGIPIYRRC